MLAGEGASIDTTTANDRLIFGIFAALAEFERALIVERTKAGLEAARARGRVGGRPFKMTPAKPAGLHSPSVEMKVADDLTKRRSEIAGKPLSDTPLMMLGGFARRGISSEHSPQVSFRIATSMACDAENGPIAIIHEASHNAAGLHDHGERGYTKKSIAPGLVRGYREHGLTREEALINADTYAAFASGLRTCSSIGLTWLREKAHREEPSKYPAPHQDELAKLATFAPAIGLGRIIASCP